LEGRAVYVVIGQKKNNACRTTIGKGRREERKIPPIEKSRESRRTPKENHVRSRSLGSVDVPCPGNRRKKRQTMPGRRLKNGSGFQAGKVLKNKRGKACWRAEPWDRGKPISSTEKPPLQTRKKEGKHPLKHPTPKTGL